jgi:hypothetical protein
VWNRAGMASSRMGADHSARGEDNRPPPRFATTDAQAWRVSVSDTVSLDSDDIAALPRPTLDARPRVAVEASLAWYDALCALHGVRCGIEYGELVGGAVTHLCSGVVELSNVWFDDDPAWSDL